LTSNKLGDNAQALAVAQALGWPSEVKRLVFTGLNHFHFRLFGPSLYKVDEAGVARHLMRQARQVVTREGGSLLVTTSRRTPKKLLT
jgi:mitochondrial fission protein ELM1